jgi:ubiquinone/menaquinone biosynthesis C-methylase UbiE
MSPTQTDFDPPEYDKYRPRYPDSLFVDVASRCKRRQRAWDCGTGTGQAAHGLTSHFEQVLASDCSAKQIVQARKARRHLKIEYKECRAEDHWLPAGSIDLVTVAEALHWFDFTQFFAEVDRVLRPGGVLAVWWYRTPAIEKGIDELVEELYRAPCLGPFWPYDRSHLDDDYARITFPYTETTAKSFTMVESWNWAYFHGYLNTWSPICTSGTDPTAKAWIKAHISRIAMAWGQLEMVKEVRWRLSLQVGIKGG